MKFYKRLLLVLPLIIITFGYYKSHNPDEKCEGVADLMVNVFFYILLFITIVLAFIGTFRKYRSKKTRFEPITFSIILFTLFILKFNSALRGHTKGDRWIFAQSKNSIHLLSKENLTLRENGNFTVDLFEADFGCSISGSYTKNSDTIILDHAAINRTDSRMTTNYLLKSNELIPLFDTISKITFNITQIK